MTRNTRARLERVEALAQALTPEPPAWAHLDDDPSTRLLYVAAALPIRLHEAIAALRDDPRLPAVEALADRMSPALAAGAAQLEAAADALERGDPIDALPRPAEAIAAAREYLWVTTNPMVYDPPGLGPGSRLHRRSIRDGVVYDLHGVEGAAAAVLDYRAYLLLNLSRTAVQLWHNRDVDEYLAWQLARDGEADEPEGEA